MDLKTSKEVNKKFPSGLNAENFERMLKKELNLSDMAGFTAHD